MKRGEERFEEEREGSYGGFQYRWNYDEYQKSLLRRRKKAADRGLRAFCVTASFVFILSFASFAAVLFLAVSGDTGSRFNERFGVKDTGQEENNSGKNEKESQKGQTERALIADKTDGETEAQNDKVMELSGDGKVLGGLGIAVKTVTEDEALLYRVPRGLLVSYVEPDSVGDRNGIRRGDILISVDGIPATDTEELSEWYETEKERISAILHLFRDGVPLDLSVISEH